MNLDGVIAVHYKDVMPKKEIYPGFAIRLLWRDESGRKVLVFEIELGTVYPA